MKFGKITDNQLQIVIQAEEGDDPEEVEKLRKKTLRAASRLQENRKVKSVTSEEYSDMTIKEAYEKFINNSKSINEKISDDTLKNYNSAYAYIKLFENENNSISKLNSAFWSELQETLPLIPNRYSTTTSLNKKGVKKVVIENEKLKSDLKSELENVEQDIKKIDKVKFKYQSQILDTLSNVTVNKHFTFYNKLMKYLEKNDFMKNTIKVETLNEEESNKETFLYKELKQLFNYELKRKDSNNYVSEEYQNMYKFAFLSGMRRGEILKMTKDCIVKVDDILCIDVEKSKTKDGIRLVPISKDMKKIIDIQYKKSRNGYLFFDNEVRFTRTSAIERSIGKRLNRKIDKFLQEAGYLDKSIKSFHSLRGNFIQELYKQYEQRKIVSETYIKMLVGHKEIKKNITFTTYNKSQVSIEILKECIDTVSLDLVYGAVSENLIEKIKVASKEYMNSINTLE